MAAHESYNLPPADETAKMDENPSVSAGQAFVTAQLWKGLYETANTTGLIRQESFALFFFSNKFEIYLVNQSSLSGKRILEQGSALAASK